MAAAARCEWHHTVCARSAAVTYAGPACGNTGIELTRGFKALKVWMSLKAYGLNRGVAFAMARQIVSQELTIFFFPRQLQQTDVQ